MYVRTYAAVHRLPVFLITISFSKRNRGLTTPISHIGRVKAREISKTDSLVKSKFPISVDPANRIKYLKGGFHCTP